MTEKYTTEIAAKGVNWNRIQDDVDDQVWGRLTSNFWLPEKVPVSNDIPSWQTLTEYEQQLTTRVFTGLTLLDTLQGTVGAMAMMPDAETQHEEAVLSNISFMEAFAVGTELLTAEGWKAIETVGEDDLVAQFDPDTETTTFAKPKIVPPHFAEEVYEIAAKNGNARQVVSGGHRVYYEEASELRQGFDHWVPTTVQARDLKTVNLNTAFRRFRSAAPAPTGAGMSSIDRLLVAINADGSFGGERYTGEKCGTIPVRFTFSKRRKIDRLKELARDAGWELRRVADSRGKENYSLAVPKKYVGDRDKRFDGWWNLAELSSTWCAEFVAELGLWDGHTLSGGGGVTFYTCREHDSDFVVAAAALSGYRSRTTLREDHRSETFSDGYVTNITWHRDAVGGQAMTVKRVEPQMVYCVQVPTTFLVTRNGESPVISGNCVHAKSYSTIFSTLCSTPQIDDAFRWADENQHLQEKARIILGYYHGDDPLKRKVASTLLESFLFYSGFYLPMRWSSRAKLTNTADVIRLIIRDEAVHGYYIGYKYQRGLEKVSQAERDTLKDYTYSLLYDLYENETHYTEDLYDPVGWTEDVKKFLRYNANKALMNLGYEGMFPKDETDVDPAILAALSPNADENHDFFSGSGSSYVMGKAVSTEDEDWAW